MATKVKNKQNGHVKVISEKDELDQTMAREVANRLTSIDRVLSPFVSNEVTSFTRLALMSFFGQELPLLDIDKECRYPRNLRIQDYIEQYTRNGVATRVISIYKEECWAMGQDIYEDEDLETETDFEAAWREMNDTLNVISNLETADEISGIGGYGAILLGFSDGGVDTPVPGLKEDGTVDKRYKNNRLLYMRPLSQQHVRITKFETNTSSPRYGLPKTYSIGLVNPEIMSSLIGTDVMSPETTMQSFKDVHWSRVIHLADNRTESNVFGTPRLQNVYNDCLNIKKVLGSAGQGFWSGGFPGLSIETHPNMESVELDKKTTKQQVFKYIQGLQRFLLLEGLTAKSLAPQVTDPKSHYETHLGNICVTKGIPLRVFKGSEEAKLASSQDMRTWNKRLAKRQNSYLTPYVIREFFNRMFLVGALPQPAQLIIKWPDLNAPTENDRATTAQKITDSLVKYITGNVFIVMPPKEYLTLVMGYPVPQVDAILESAGVKKMLADLEKIFKIATTLPPAPAAGGKKLPGKNKKPAVDSGAGPA